MTSPLSWIDLLPGVAGTDIPVRRAHIEQRLNQAAELEAHAAMIREAAYFDACTLESDARARWCGPVVDAAKVQLIRSLL